MKTATKTLFSLSLLASISLGGNAAFAASSTMTDMNMAAGGTLKVQVMNHLCGSSIKNMDDFKALEAGRDPVAALANTVLNCPTTGLPGNAATPGSVASPRATYQFGVWGQNGTSQTLGDSTFMQHQLCESDLQKDVNGDGKISASTCLDISHYEFPSVSGANDAVTVTETMPAAGYHMGALRFTPPVIDGNNDAESLTSFDASTGTIKLDMTNDADKTVMLHVYNFQNSSGMSMNSSSMNSSMSSASRQMVLDQIQALLAQIQAILNGLK